ncbi:MAG: adenylate/guanylate cyclase domain-containing protein [Microscillaceae bacterium]|nr:adenylate/guanylate cyclase domain-containing protein [Microscillaceae bacterium]
MRKVILFFGICLFLQLGFVTFILAQSNLARQEIKNLLRDLRANRDDSTRITILLELSEFVSGISLDSSAHYAERAFHLANKIKHPDLAVKALSLLGDIYRLNNKPDKAVKYYMLAEEKMKGLPFSERDAYALYYAAEVLREKEEIKGAERYYLKALDIVNHQDESSTQTIKFIILTGLINLYKSQENYSQALEKYNLIEKVHKGLLQEDFVILNKSEVGSLIKSMRNDILDAQSKRMRTFTNMLILFGVLVLLVIVVTLYILNIRRKKMNTILSIKNHELDQEKRKVDELLLNIFPKEIAEELKTQGKSDIKTYERVSVLFTDFKGFTQIAEKMSPQKLIQELNDCFTHFDEIIKKYNLEKIKTIGDAYMCAGGIPISNLTNPVDIVLAGLDIQRFMKKRKEEKMASGEKYWECRLGINTGEVIAGVIGKSKFAYDIWSDTVNTASRTETNGEVYKVNITQRTYHFVKDFFDCEYRGKITAKGKGVLDMYFVHGIKADLSVDGKGEDPTEAFYQLRDKIFREYPEPAPKV